MDLCCECGGSFDLERCFECNRVVHWECLMLCDKDYSCNGMFCLEHANKHECAVETE